MLLFYFISLLLLLYYTVFKKLMILASRFFSIRIYNFFFLIFNIFLFLKPIETKQNVYSYFDDQIIFLVFFLLFLYSKFFILLSGNLQIYENILDETKRLLFLRPYFCLNQFIKVCFFYKIFLILFYYSYFFILFVFNKKN